jgi:cytochrome c oxidase subunit 1
VGGVFCCWPDITNSVFEAPLLPLNQFISISAFILGIVQVIFVINFFYSLFRGPAAGRNPWNSNTLEWTAPSPPPHGNFDVTPVVFRWPYEYGEFNGQGDHRPQTEKGEGGLSAAPAH